MAKLINKVGKSIIEMSERKVSRRKYIAVAGVAVVATAIGGAAYYLSRPPKPTPTPTPTPTATPAPTPSMYGGIMVMGTPWSVKEIDPHFATKHDELRQAMQVCDRLVDFDEEFNIVGTLAKSWDISLDKKSYTFQLREGVMCHVGRELTAEDVAYSLNRINSWESSKAYFPVVDFAEATAKYTVVLHLTKPHAPLLSNLANPGARGAMIVPKLTDDELDKYGVTREEFEEIGFKNFLVGTGPFKLIKILEGQYERFEKFDDYWKKDEEGGLLPYLDGYETRPQTDASLRYIHLRTGETDMMFTVSGVDAPSIEENPDLTLFQGSGCGWMMVGFNHKKPPFDDVRMRKAVALAVDRNAIIDVAFHGYADPTYSPLPHWNRYYIEVPGYRKNIELAKSLMIDAGYESVDCTYLWYTIDPCPSVATVIKEQLKEININATLKIVEIGTYFDLGKPDVPEHELVGHWWSDKIDPYISLSPRVRPGGSMDLEGNKYTSDEMLALFEELGTTVDETKKRNLIEQIQTKWMEDLPTVPLYSVKSLQAYANYVHNFWADPQGVDIPTEKIWLDPEHRRETYPS